MSKLNRLAKDKYKDKYTVLETPLLDLTLWPNKSFGKKDHIKLVSLLYIFILIPILPFLGHKAIYVLLPFSFSTIFFLYFCLRLNSQQQNLYENIKIWHSLIQIKRVDPDGRERIWSANPYWARTRLYPTDEKVSNYLTVKGNGREIEVGSFLDPNERLAIKKQIDRIIKNI